MGNHVTVYDYNIFDLKNSYNKNINPKRGIELQKMSRNVEEAPGPLNYLRELSKKAKLEDIAGYGLEMRSPPQSPAKKDKVLKSKDLIFFYIFFVC